MYDEEDWFVLEEFPEYSISTFGEVMNNKTKRLMKSSITARGSVKVGLTSGGRQHSRLIKLLVARTFIYGETDIFDTPINLDGDPLNNRVDNLVWRPRWFSLKYTKQFKVFPLYIGVGPILEVDSGELHADILSAAVSNGLLFEDVYASCINKVRIFPTWQLFTFAP